MTTRRTRTTARPREHTTPPLSARQRAERQLESAAALHPDIPPERRPVVIRASDLAELMADCPPEHP